MSTVAIDGYRVSAAELASRFEVISPDDLYAPVVDHLPTAPTTILDVGAGTGRDAAWFSGKGHDVVAVEPVCELQDAGDALRRDHRVRWMEDRLPALTSVVGLGRTFDFILVSAVWQHLDLPERLLAMETLAALLGDGASMVISLRHGPGAPTRPVYACEPSETVDSARRSGLVLLSQRTAVSMQAANRMAGVEWTWLTFARPEPGVVWCRSPRMAASARVNDGPLRAAKLCARRGSSVIRVGHAR